MHGVHGFRNPDLLNQNYAPSNNGKSAQEASQAPKNPLFDLSELGDETRVTELTEAESSSVQGATSEFSGYGSEWSGAAAESSTEEETAASAAGTDAASSLDSEVDEISGKILGGSDASTPSSSGVAEYLKVLQSYAEMDVQTPVPSIMLTA
jgi:hypothetical protein